MTLTAETSRPGLETGSISRDTARIWTALPDIRHPRGRKAKILLSSVFGPYAQDDEYGSRSINPMELYHNQVTRVQGPFSLRMFHRSFGMLLIQANVEAPCTQLDFPTLDRFVEELRSGDYDIVGIGAILPNVGKVKKMCELIRQHLPAAQIVVGGHVANMPGLQQMVDADHIVRGDGVSWFRGYLGQDIKAPIKHPAVYSAFGTRSLGVQLTDKPGDTAAMLIPSVGCPMGCNFCSTSHMFGGKGKFIHFYETGDELFEVMCDLEKKLNVQSFFAMDENFLLHRKRALRLLELMEQHGKSWALYVFSSARVISSYTMDQLVRLGISWVWMGLEGRDSQYVKLSGIQTPELIRELQSNGIRVLGSSIIGLENHCAETIDAAIDWSVSHDTVFHQFMLYTPVPGTPLYEHHRSDGSLLGPDEISYADTHGQYRFNYRHPLIPPGDETEFLLRAFRKDFEVNGPSIARLIRTTLNGWKKYKNHPDPRVRKRYEWEARSLKTTYAGAIWAMRKWYRDTEHIHAKMDKVLKDLYREFGFFTRLAVPLLGRLEYFFMKKEEARLASGWTYEPPCICEKNEAALAALAEPAGHQSA